MVQHARHSVLGLGELVGWVVIEFPGKRASMADTGEQTAFTT